MTRELITPRTLRGFTDLLPHLARHRRRMTTAVEQVFSRFGYEPIATPALEYAEILRGKGGSESDKQIFEFSDQGGRAVALRFDLTVPLARFVAEHQGQLTFPFRAYNIGHVWRGERPQRGRYREFLQCDVDIIGETGPAADAEILVMIEAALKALDIGDFVLRVNNRGILNGLLEDLGLSDRSSAVLRTLDKIEKIGRDGVETELREAEVPAEAAAKLLAFVGARQERDEDTIAAVTDLLPSDSAAHAGIDAVRNLLALVGAAGVAPERVAFDPTIARGLDYYTGMVYETSLLSAPQIGSISSGGRYDDLAGLYTKSRLPGVGGSIGISRLLAALDGTEWLPEQRERPLVVVLQPPGGDTLAAVALASALRDGHFDVELYPAERKHGAQMKFAATRGAAVAVQAEQDGSVFAKALDSGRTATFAHAPTAAELTALAAPTDV